MKTVLVYVFCTNSVSLSYLGYIKTVFNHFKHKLGGIETLFFS